MSVLYPNRKLCAVNSFLATTLNTRSAKYNLDINTLVAMNFVVKIIHYLFKAMPPLVDILSCVFVD